MTLKLRWGQLEVALSSRGRLGSGWRCGAVAILDRCAVPSLWRGANFVLAVGWRCDAMAILDRYVVLRCSVVPVFACKVCLSAVVECLATNYRQFLFFGALLEEHVGSCEAAVTSGSQWRRTCVKRRGPS